MMRINNTAAPYTGASTTLSTPLMYLLTCVIVSSVAPLVPSIIWSALAFRLPYLDFQLISNILFHIDMRDKRAGIQHAAARSVPMPNVSFAGAGIT
jgi:hypothetical protein